jgi:glycerophosphoryl diester phosphodiesterase
MISFRGLAERETPLIIAHRGASRAAHENTLEAFRLAIAMGADAIECDVRRTADGVLVIHHDPAIGRNPLSIAGSAYNHLAQAARDEYFELATLQQTLEMCAGHIALDVELKEMGHERQTLDLVRTYYDPSNVLFTSFRDATVLKLKTLAPDAVAGLLLSAAPLPALLKTQSRYSVTGRLRRCRADLVAPHWRRLRRGFLHRMHRLQIPVVAWTVDDPGRARKLAGAGVAGIISNVPDLIRSAPDSHPQGA